MGSYRVRSFGKYSLHIVVPKSDFKEDDVVVIASKYTTAKRELTREEIRDMIREEHDNNFEEMHRR